MPSEDIAPYRVEWLTLAGQTHALDFKSRVAAVGRFDRAVRAGVDWALFINTKTGHVYEEHGDRAVLI